MFYSHKPSWTRLEWFVTVLKSQQIKWELFAKNNCNACFTSFVFIRRLTGLT